MKVQNIDIPLEKVKIFCDLWKVRQFALFGSVLRDDFQPTSDIDVMVQFEPDAFVTFVNLEDMEAKLVTIFDRKIDLVTRDGIKNSRNYLRREESLNSAKVVYEL